MRGPYARQTEITRDETRQSLRDSRSDAHEVKACEETIKACNAFLKSRGLLDGSDVMITNDASNIRLRKKQPARRKEQNPQPTKSLKAALMRETIIDARRRGVIKPPLMVKNSLPMSDWGDIDE